MSGSIRVWILLLICVSSIYGTSIGEMSEHKSDESGYHLISSQVMSLDGEQWLQFPE